MEISTAIIIFLIGFLCFIDLVFLCHNLPTMFSYIFRKYKLIKNSENYFIGFRQFFLFIPLNKYNIVKELTYSKNKNEIIKQYYDFILDSNPKIVKLRKKVIVKRRSKNKTKHKQTPKKDLWQTQLF